jgi:hypothetical protein
MSDIKPFDPTIPKEEVDRLFRKLADTRLPQTPVVPDAGDDYGINDFQEFSQTPANSISQVRLSNGFKSSTAPGSIPSPGR